MSASPTVGRWYRRDITGLRSLAIIPVVAFHAGATFLPGGFIGVDVFYVISGFLITTLLVNEAEASGRIRLGTFWAKRIRRLVPALIVMVAVTLPVAAILSTVLGWDALAMQAGASALYLANILFWRESTDYFDTGSGQSPYLHMWSLGVEEQFYIVWPLLVIAGFWLARRRYDVRTTLAVIFAIVFVSSLALSVWYTPISPNAAFYLLPTRAWEFAGAGLIALLPIGRLVTSRPTASVLALLGLAILVYGFFTISDADLYPGYLALIPFVGTLLLIVSGGGRSPVTAALESKPAVWLGNVSYSWYLWHWPLIVFAAALYPGNGFAVAAAGVLSLGVGALSYHFIEQPLRFAPFLTSSAPRTYLVGATATAAVVALAFGVAGAGTALLQSEPLKTYALAAETRPSSGCEDGEKQLFGETEACVLGDPDGVSTIAVIGDSHAGHWRAAADAAAAEAGYRLVFRWKSACPSFDITIGDLKAVQDPTCNEYRDETMQILEAVRPDGVIISNAYGYTGRVLDETGTRLPLAEQRSEWRRGMVEQITAIEAIGARVAVIRDNPRMLFNPTSCLSRLGATPSDCASTPEDAQVLISDFSAVTDEVIAERGISPTFSTDGALCGSGMCQAVIDGVPVYQDQTHLSRMWTLTQTPALVAFFNDIVE